MGNASFARLEDRHVVAIGGADAEDFLQNIVTTDMAHVVASGAGFGALLSPQGKILFDFLIFRADDGFLFDLPAVLVADFVRRTTLYRLRAKVTIADRSAESEVVAVWGADAPPAIGGVVAADPRLAALGWRAIVGRGADLSSAGQAATAYDYAAWRIAHTVPEGGRDFAFGDAFPHDADMDDLGGLDFRKGCYVGQEIVARMQHRGTARRRAVAIVGATPLPSAGTPVEAGGRPLGTLGSVSGTAGIAILRLDRTKAAIDAETPITAGGVPLAVSLPAFARFGWPTASEEEGAA